MNSTDLKPDQLAHFRRQIGAQLAYLGRLRDRMTRVGFRGDDKLFVATCDAYNAAQGIYVELHYLTCTKGTREVTAIVARWRRGGL